MARNLLVLLCIVMISTTVVFPVNAQASFETSLQANTTVTWNIIDAPDTAFSLFFSGSDSWLAADGTQMVITILEIMNDVEVRIELGNNTWTANDTDLAKDLTLGVWGLTEWLPGFFIEVGTEKLNDLNATAYASAERTVGNYMNGTMVSDYESLTINGKQYDCIVFRYLQDDSGFGEPQSTVLAYDIDSGILVRCNSTYSFGVPYNLVLELNSIDLPIPSIWLTLSVIGVVVVVLVVFMVFRFRK